MVTVNQQYRIRFDLGLIIEAQYAAKLSAIIEAQYGIVCRPLIESEFDILFSLSSLINAEHNVKLDLLAYTPVNAEHGIKYGAKVEVQHGLNYSLQALIDFEYSSLNSSTTTIDQQYNCKFALQSFNPVQTQYGMISYLGPSPVINVTDSIQVFHNGRKIEILGASIKIDEGDPLWLASIALAKPADYVIIKPLDAITATLGGDTFALIVEKKSKGRSFARLDLSIDAASPGILLTAPYADAITKTWGAISAKDAVEEILGEAVTWNIPDWIISSGRLAVSNATPMDAAQSIANAAGGVIQSAPGGGFIVRPLFPVSVPAWPGAAVVATLADDLNNLSSNEIYQHKELVDCVTISDTSESNTQDKTEYVANADNPLNGILYAIPIPWRPIQVAHTGHAAVGLAPLGVVYRQKTELVEFKEGRASVGDPIYSIDSTKWQYKNLGSIAFAGNELTSIVAGYSLCNITYTVKTLAYNVSDTIAETIQFLVMEQ